MSRADDLASVFADLRDQGPAFGFRQGTVIAWDFVSGEGAVSVAGTVLTDVPFLTMTGSLIYLPGDTVILFKQGASWMVFGKVSTPGGVAGIGRNTQASQGFSTAASNFALTTSHVTKVTQTINLPIWCEAVTLQATLQAWCRNSTASSDFLEVRLELPDGGVTALAWPSDTAPTLTTVGAEVTLANTFAVTPGGSIDVIGQARATTGAWAVNALNRALLTTVVTYNSSGA